MLTAIMTEPDFGEAMFLVAIVIFVVGAIIAFMRTPPAWPPAHAFIALGLAVLALGWLAL